MILNYSWARAYADAVEQAKATGIRHVVKRRRVLYNSTRQWWVTEAVS